MIDKLTKLCRGVKSIHFIVFMLMVSVTLSACKSNRSILKVPIKEEGADFLLEKLTENEFKFNTFTSRLAIDYTYDRKKLDFKGQVRIVKDSAIWISFNQDLGIEMVRLLITEDTVKFIDRINRTYFVGDYAFVNDFLSANIDFGILQSLLLGNDFEYYEDASFRASIDSRQYRLNTTGRGKLKSNVRNSDDNTRNLLQTLWLNPETFKITEIRLKELTRNSKKLTAVYSGFQNIENQQFPTKVDYSIEADVPIKVTVRHSRMTLNQPASMPFNVPEKYTTP
jgi:hypothetical protein